MTMSGYTKLFSSIVASTIWREDDKTRILWITLLALSDKDGFVAGSIPGLSDLARMSIADCEQGLQKLQLPDQYSRTTDFEGRRIEVIDGGWFILNRAKYRDLIPDERRRERDRIRQQRHRQPDRQDAAVSRVTGCDSHDLSHQTETETETEKEKEKEKPSSEPCSSDLVSVLPLKKIAKEPSQEACRLAALFKSEIHRNKSDFRITPAQERSWAVTAQRMIDLDKRDPSEIEKLIQWVQHDDFWMSNVLSMDKLRKQFDQLQLKREHQGRKSRHADFEHKDYKEGLTENADGSYR